MDYLSFWQKNRRRNLWQHPIWEDFQKAIDRKTWLLETKGASALAIKHNMPIGLNWLEIPRGPLFENEKSLSDILIKIREFGKKEKSVFIRISSFEELRITKDELRMSKYDNQPQTSLIIDLDHSEEEILKQMKPKGRYNIKVAEKHGVTVKESQDINDFYALLQKTSGRDGFSAHPKNYYQKMLKSMPKNAQLLLAEHQGKVIAGGIFVYLDRWGIYYYGASDYEHRNLMAPYLVQWEAIKEAKKRGCKRYDFLGIAPENAKKHPWKGVTEFKKKFGGRIKNYPQAQEMVLRPFWYWVYSVYKRIKS